MSITRSELLLYCTPASRAIIKSSLTNLQFLFIQTKQVHFRSPFSKFLQFDFLTNFVIKSFSSRRVEKNFNLELKIVVIKIVAPRKLDEILGIKLVSQKRDSLMSSLTGCILDLKIVQDEEKLHENQSHMCDGETVGNGLSIG